MPYLSKREIEAIATRVVNAYQRMVGTTGTMIQRVCPEVLIRNLLGLNITYRTLSIDGSILGMTAFDQVGVRVYENKNPTHFYLDGKTVLIESALTKPDANPGRLHFTLVHEASHQILKMLFPKEYPHQSINAFEEENHLWRKGKLCVDLIDQTLGIRVPEKEPFTVDERLFWNMQRAVLWLRAAAEERLIKNGDAFELPDFPVSHIQTVFAFQEDCVSMMIWESTDERCGIARIVRRQLSSEQSIAMIRSFRSIDSQKAIYQPVWGTAIREKNYENALWIRLKEVPVINNWQVPTNLCQLKQICTNQGIDLLAILKSFAPKARDGRRHLLLVGFPIPAHIGEDSHEMTWQAIELPALSCGKYTNRVFHSGKRLSIPQTYGARKGYRPSEAGWWMNDKAKIFLDSMELSWIRSENWSARTIKGRGKLANRLANQRIVMIGLGSLGASIAELLTRAGATQLTCIDGNALEMGNLCRHTLCMTDLYQSKSKLVAKRLTNIDPNIHTTYAERYLDIDETGALVPDLSSFDIIIDSTGEDQVLALLSATEWKRKIVFCSSSVGLGAKRLYINIQRTKLPHFENFLNLVEPYFQKDSNDFNLDALPRDGIGCWHPLFPARADDMWFAACTTVKALEAFVQNSTEKGISLIYETQTEDGLFNGLRLIEKQYEYREN